MKLKNKARRLITINTGMTTNKDAQGKVRNAAYKSVDLMPAGDAVEVDPSKWSDKAKAYVEALAKAGDIEVIEDDKRTSKDDPHADMSNDDLKSLLESAELSIEGKFSRAKAVSALQEAGLL